MSARSVLARAARTRALAQGHARPYPWRLPDLKAGATSVSKDGSGAHPAPTHCENCATPLQGGFCHACGQSVHNPVRHMGHALEEFFEAFWHLDGRVFRTLRDLMFPGRVAVNYLAGHRARYIAPLRLFVVLSVLTFFIGAVAVHVDDRAGVTVTGLDAISAAATADEVERIRDEALAGLEQLRAEAGNAPGVDPALIAGEVRIRAAAADRLVELGAAPTGGEAAAVARERASRRLQLNMLGHSGEWHPVDNPLVVAWLPGFANDWLNYKLGNFEENLRSVDRSSADEWVQGMMAAAPSALFLLVPLFALLLKIAYLFTGRLYLEHLVVALYSHAFLLIMLTLAFVLSAIGDWASPGVLGVVPSLCFAAVLLWMPVYLLLMQKRAYGQAWWLTVLKYVVVGIVYFVLLLAATLLVFLARLTAA